MMKVNIQAVSMAVLSMMLLALIIYYFMSCDLDFFYWFYLIFHGFRQPIITLVLTTTILWVPPVHYYAGSYCLIFHELLSIIAPTLNVYYFMGSGLSIIVSPALVICYLLS